MAVTVILPRNEYSAALRDTLAPLLPPGSGWRDPDRGLADLKGQKLLFAVALDEGGCNLACYRMLSALRRDAGALDGCLGAVVVTGRGELYTKDVARDLVLAANLSGCAFLGRPLVEATGSLRNFHVQAMLGGTDERTAFHLALEELTGRLESAQPPPPPRRILALHASVRSASNTLDLWDLVKRACRRGWRRRSCASTTASWQTAPDAATPPASTLDSRGGASTAAPWWRRCSQPSGPATPW